MVHWLKEMWPPGSTDCNPSDYFMGCIVEKGSYRALHAQLGEQCMLTWSFHAHPTAFQAYPGAKEAHPEAVEAHLKAVVAHPGAVEDHPGAIKYHPGAFLACLSLGQ